MSLISAFKFRSFDNYVFLLDILLNERLYCSNVDYLNDPKEGIFVLEKHLRLRSGKRLIFRNGSPIKLKSLDPQSILKTLKGDINYPRNVCSLSSDVQDFRLWAYYGGSLTGMAIEIEIDDNDPLLHEVTYSPDHVCFNKAPSSQEEVLKILTTKHVNWEHEKELRIISNEQYFPINGSIKAIWLGPRINDLNKDIIQKIVDDKFPVIETDVDNLKHMVIPK